jgi:hypothetical protein
MTTPTNGYPADWTAGEYNPSDHFMQIDRYDRKTSKKVPADYLNVQQRTVWFIRDQRAMIVSGIAKVPYTIQTEIVEIDRQQGWAHFKTYIRDVLGNEVTMYGSESAADFGDFIEKASTKSVGRALAILGYGTAQAIELDEGEERPVDAPVERPAQTQRAPQPQRPAQSATQQPVQQRPTQPQNGEAMATDRQITSIRKLCLALNRTEPDLATLTFAAARELLTELSHAYSEQRNASASGERR